MDPETRPSLMLRLRKADDQEAWARFVSIYEPLVFRLVRRRGLQEADARDVTQQVIIAVLNAVDTWRPDEKSDASKGQVVQFATSLLDVAQKENPDHANKIRAIFESRRLTLP